MRLQDGAAGTLATITAGNALKVDGSGVTQPVSGTVAANAGSGTFTNQQTNVTLDYDSGAGTQSLTLWGLALPASGGAVAGGTGTNPLRIDPTGATPQPVSGTVAISGTVAVTQSGTWSMRAQDGSGNNITSASRGSERALTVQIVDGSGAQVTTFGGSGGTASNFGSAFPSSGTATGFSDGTNMQAGRVIDADTGAGTIYAQGVNLLKRASGGPVEAGTASDPLRVDPTGTTTQPVSGTVTANAGTGNFTVAQAIGTNLHMVCDSGCTPGGSTADNSAFTFGTTALNPAGYVFDDTAPNAVTENNVATPRMSANRVPYGMLRDAAGNERGANVTAGNALVVDGSGVIQPVSGTVTANQGGTWNIGTVTTLPALPANQSVNMAQINGVAASMGNGISGTGVQRVTLASDSTGQVAVASLPNEGQQTSANSISVAIASDQSAVPVSQATAANLNTRPDTSGATGAAPPARADYVGGLASGATGGFVSGFAVCDSFANVNISTATTTLLVTGVSGRHVRICSLSLVTAGANNIALISGTGATCATGTTGMTGGTTAASGYNFAANGGITQGNGLGTINQTNATGDSVCVVTSAATQLSGRIAYAIY